MFAPNLGTTTSVVWIDKDNSCDAKNNLKKPEEKALSIIKQTREIELMRYYR